MLKNKLLSAMGGAPANYIEDVFSTYLYTGNGSTQTITNGIDLAGKGGLVWSKRRNVSLSNLLFDTARGNTKFLVSNTAGAEGTDSPATYLTSFNSNGFSVGSAAATNNLNDTYVSWTFRKQPKFFDVVTYTGTGSARTIAHNLGSAPGCVIIKCTSQAYVWAVYHRGMTSAAFAMQLQATDAQSSEPTYFNSTAPTSTVFSVGTANATNQSGQTYVAYIFAHNAGGFGLTGTDNVISCGSYTGNGSSSGPTVTLGYEPQWLLIKEASSTGAWFLTDTMRGFSQTSDQFLQPNSSGAEFTKTNYVKPLATGFQIVNADFDVNESGGTYIYIAIRRGPMKTPTSGTSVFSPVLQSAGGTVTTGFPVDLSLSKDKSSSLSAFIDRLRGDSTTYFNYLSSTNTDAETTGTGAGLGLDSNTGYRDALFGGGSGRIYWNFRRAPGFFDEVCYTGTGSARTVAHNLGVAPELMIVKRRSGVADWPVYSSAVGNTKFLLLNSTGDTITDNVWNNTTPTATEFSVRDQNTVNASGSTYVAYLFATVAGVSKVGSYTGTGTTQQINCGFTAGARFVLIKRTDSTGDWYVWDSARGIVAGNDSYLLLNSTAAEVTSTDYIDTYSAGFEISSTAPAAINASGGTFLFLAVA